MAENRKTYYQISFTGAQALSAILLVLVALAVSFFLGAKGGFEKSTQTALVPADALPAPAPTKTEIAPLSSTGTAAPAASSASAGAPAGPAASTGAAAAPPSTEEAQVFEDREAGVSEEKPEKAPSRTEIAVPARPGPKGAPPKASTPAPKGSESAPKSASTRPSPAAPASPAGFFVQVLSTSSKPEATRWKGRLEAKKYGAVLSMVEGKSGKMYRLRLGPYKDKEQAKKIAAKVSKEFKRQAWVAPEE